MVFRRSLRRKFIFTFLIGSLATVVLFSLVIRGVITGHFERQGEVRGQFVQEQGQRTIQANLAVFKDNFEQYFDAVAAALGPICESGLIGDRFSQIEAERQEFSATLRDVQQQLRLSMITVMDRSGRTLVRSTNPGQYGDQTLVLDYESSAGPVSSARRLIQAALNGRTIRSFESFAPQILEKEIYVAGGAVTGNTLRDQARLELKSAGVPVPPGQFEDRGLMMTVVSPVRNSSHQIVGAALAARLLNKDQSFVRDIQGLLQDRASIFLGRVRVATTVNITSGRNVGENATGTLLGEETSGRVLGRGEYIQREFDIGGEKFVGVYEPIRNHENQIIGAMWLGRPQSFFDSIIRSQQVVEEAVERRTNVYIVALGLVSLLLSIFIASILSSRIGGQIDQLRKGAEVIAQGNLDYRLGIHSGDEIELLADQFNTMASKLEESYQNLEKKVEERTRELKESQAAMIQQEKMVGIGQLAAGIAHELNTPLSTIIGYAQMLREDLSQEKSAANLSDVDEVIGQAGRCRDLVKNLLNFSRRSTAERTGADLNAIVRKILSLIEHDFEMKRIRIHMILDPSLPKAKVNENEIAQVILNLSNNAADSMTEGGDLHVSTRYDASSDRIEIALSDTGSGIKESDRNRIFEPFFTTKEVGKGTGLGLSICYKIVENHQGTMEFKTGVSGGTTFKIYLPVNAEVKVG